MRFHVTRVDEDVFQIVTGTRSATTTRAGSAATFPATARSA